jgi:hypothetical protein
MMRDRESLPNPYAARLDDPDGGRPVLLPQVLANAVALGIVTGGGLVLSGTALAADVPAPAVATGYDDASDAWEPADAGPAARADRFVAAVTGRIADAGSSLEARLAALTASGDRACAERAREVLDALWRPASAGIADLAGSVARVATSVDPDGPPNSGPASPALLQQPSAAGVGAHELLDRMGSCLERMTTDLLDTVHAEFDRAEAGDFATPALAGAAASTRPMLKVLPGGREGGDPHGQR